MATPYAQPVAGQPVYMAGSPPPQPVYVQQQPMVMGAPPVAVVAVAPVRFDEIPVVCVCQFCGYNGPTHVEFVNGLLTWALCGGICIIGGFVGCCLIPFCLNSCKDVHHHCGSCRNVVGVCKRIK